MLKSKLMVIENRALWADLANDSGLFLHKSVKFNKILLEIR